MRRRRAVGGPGTAVLLCVAIVVLLLTSAGPGKATPVDLFQTPPTGWTIVSHGCSTSTTDCASATDANDATYAQHTQEGGSGCQQVNPWHSINASRCYFDGRFSRSSGVTSFTIDAYRIKFDKWNASVLRGYKISVEPEGAGSSQVCKEVVADSSGDDITGSCDAPVTVVTGDHLTVSTYADWSGNAVTRMYSFEVYASLTTAVGIETYCANMRVDHPSLQWTGTCTWTQSFHGTVALTTSPAGTIYTNVSPDVGVHHNPSVSYTPSGGWGPANTAIGGAAYILQFWQDCFPLCESDSVTLSITDTDNDQTASFTFLRSANGAVQTPTQIAEFLSWHACYNVTTDKCGNGSASSTTDIDFCTRGSPANYQVGPRSNTDTRLFHATPYTASAQAAGCYTSFGLSTPTTTYPVWMFATTNAAGTSIRIVTVDYTGGTIVGGTTVVDPREQASDCGAFQVLCDFWDWSSAGARDRVSAAVDDLTDLALSRQPFNFIARSLEGVGGQLSRATAEVGETTDCPGLHIEVPWDVWIPESYRPTGAPLEFYLLRCSDFEPFVATTWYQAIRTAMDPALYLAYGYVWVKRLQPRPVMAG